jgi:hypothetical protein
MFDYVQMWLFSKIPTEMSKFPIISLYYIDFFVEFDKYLWRVLPILILKCPHERLDRSSLLSFIFRIQQVPYRCFRFRWICKQYGKYVFLDTTGIWWANQSSIFRDFDLNVNWRMRFLEENCSGVSRNKRQLAKHRYQQQVCSHKTCSSASQKQCPDISSTWPNFVAQELIKNCLDFNEASEASCPCNRFTGWSRGFHAGWSLLGQRGWSWNMPTTSDFSGHYFWDIQTELSSQLPNFAISISSLKPTHLRF